MKNLYRFLFCLVLVAPVIALAQGSLTYQSMVSIPGFSGDPTTTDGFSEFVNILYAIAISVAALLAVIKIVIAGLKWMLSDVVTSKSDAKKDIQGALVGLLIVISAVLIITIINPAIVGGGA